MRPVELANLKMGINRLRVKGGANPSTLYDLYNGWITADGSVNPREGTSRFATLDSTTKGLMANDGSFNVFSIVPVTVPAGFTDNVLVNPSDATQTIKKIWFAKPFMGFPYIVAEFANGSVFHYWLQNGGTWAANTVYTAGTLILPTTPTGLAYAANRISLPNSLWQPQVNITLGTIVEPTEANGYMFRAVAVGGSSPHTGSTEPTWPITSGALIQEFGDFDLNSTDTGTTNPGSTAQPLANTITDRYGDSSDVASGGTASGNDLTTPTQAAETVTVWTAGTLYAPGAVVQPSTGQGAFIGAIPNGDFENGDDGNWIFSTGAVQYSTTHQYQGTECLSFTAAHGTNTATMLTFGVVVPGQSVTASAYLNPNSTGADLDMWVSLRWYSSSDVFISQTDGPHQENGGYRLASVTGTAPALAVHCRVMVSAGNNTTARTGYCDLVSWNLETPAAVSNFLYEAVQANPATSGTVEPTWPTVAGNTVVDNGVAWKAIGTSIITWEAIPIMQSGATEPTWPTTVGLAVADPSTFTDQLANVNNTSISWIASSRQITDPKDPNTKVVALAASHVFAGDNDIVDFSAAVDPTDWSTENNAGYLPTGLNNYGDNPAAVLALYRSNLIVMNAGGYQMWQVDPDPANMALLDAQPVGSIYTQAAQSVANDLLFLTEVGVRNLGTAGANANMQIGNLGQPIDALVRAQLKAPSASATLTMTAAAQDPNFGQEVLLLHFDGTNGQTTTVDSSSVGNTVSLNQTVHSTFANPNLATAVEKFGPSSLLVPVNDYSGGVLGGIGYACRVPATSGYAQTSPLNIFPTSNWTIECFYNPLATSGPTTRSFVFSYGDPTTGATSSFEGTCISVYAELDGNGTTGTWNVIDAGAFRTGSTVIYTSPTSVPIVNGTWYHVAAVNDAGNSGFTLYINGVAIFNDPHGLDPSAYQGWVAGLFVAIGSFASSSQLQSSAYIDEFCVSTFSKYLANFTPPAKPFGGAIGYEAGNFGTLNPTSFAGADSQTYTVTVLEDQGPQADNFALSATYTGGAPTKSSVFSSISFIDTNGTPRSFSPLASTFSASGGTATWIWTQGEGEMFTAGGTYIFNIGLSAGGVQPISLYYPGRGQYWLIFGAQAFVLTVNGTGLKTWSRFVFPESITDWCLNAGNLYLRTATDKIWLFDDTALQDDVGGTAVDFLGWMQWPYMDAGTLGYNKMLVGVDLIGTGKVNIKVAYREDDSTTFIDNPGFATSLNVTPDYIVNPSDITPGTPVPIPLTAPSMSLILIFQPNQAWEWQAANMYVQDFGNGQTS